ncbi:Uncharacterised protein [Enterobacter cloacae]|nr:Uncharacterised protein [Enterobacter cloacae]
MSIKTSCFACRNEKTAYLLNVSISANEQDFAPVKRWEPDWQK